MNEWISKTQNDPSDSEIFQNRTNKQRERQRERESSVGLNYATGQNRPVRTLGFMVIVDQNFSPFALDKWLSLAGSEQQSDGRRASFGFYSAVDSHSIASEPRRDPTKRPATTKQQRKNNHGPIGRLYKRILQCGLVGSIDAYVTLRLCQFWSSVRPRLERCRRRLGHLVDRQFAGRRGRQSPPYPVQESHQVKHRRRVWKAISSCSYIYLFIFLAIGTPKTK
jgi:hypothetical protein